MRHQKFATCVCLFSVITCTIAAPIGNSTLKIKCCDVWRFLSDLTIEFTGSSFDCVDNACEDLHLVRRFVSESNVMLGVKDLSLPQPISYVDDNCLKNKYSTHTRTRIPRSCRGIRWAPGAPGPGRGGRRRITGTSCAAGGLAGSVIRVMITDPPMMIR